jgi:UDP:flavonoid glycosyltransferase YjiC (YdhE family)
MRFVFFTWDGGGNQPPAVGIAQELRQRGHDVLFAGYASQQARFDERGFVFHTLEGAQALWERLSSAHPWIQLRDSVMVCPAHLDDVPTLLARESADVLVVDCLLLGALLAAERSGIPVAVLIHSAPGALLHPMGWLGQQLPDSLNALRATVGREPVGRIWDAWEGLPAFCATIPQLDPLAHEMPPTCTYVGPIFERVSSSHWHVPWPPDDARPLVLVSFSTQEVPPQRSRIVRTLAALAHRPYRVLVVAGAAAITGVAVPENAVITRFVPHGEVLPHAAVVVTHAGHGTLAAALAQGIPLVCLPNPVVADQSPLAAQVEALGAGLALDGEVATSADVAAAVDTVLADISYTAAARRLAATIAAMPGVSAVGAQLERCGR